MNLDAQLERAKALWRTFHQKGVRRIVTLEPSVEWPTEWGRAGRCTRVFYASDKWHKDGEIYNYYHPHGEGVECLEPLGAQTWLEPVHVPRRDLPAVCSVLGSCLGWVLVRQDGVELYAETGPDDFLLAHPPDGNVLSVYDAKARRITALIRGPGLRVERRGIVG